MEVKNYEFTIYVPNITREEAENLLGNFMLEAAHCLDVVGSLVEVQDVQEEPE